MVRCLLLNGVNRWTNTLSFINVNFTFVKQNCKIAVRSNETSWVLNASWVYEDLNTELGVSTWQKQLMTKQMWRWVWNMAWWHTWAVKQRQVWTVEQRTRSCRVSFHGHSRRGMGGHLEYKMAVTITGSTKVRPRTSGTTRLGETTRLGTLGRWRGSLDGRRLWRGGLDLRRFWCGG